MSVAVVSVIAPVAGIAKPQVGSIASQPAPADNLDYWLRRAQPAATQPVTTQPAARKADGFHRDDALPGVIELTDGSQLAGGIYTTREMPWKVWVEAKKRWRRVPPIAVLSITVQVVSERMELQWRWKETGAPEKVYTGRKYPFRRLLWRFRLIDGSVLTGAVKGQPIWIETRGKPVGPMLLSERVKGPVGAELKDLVHVERVVISRRMMDRALVAQAKRADKARR